MDIEQKTERKAMRHEGCGGTVTQAPGSTKYVCDRCNASAPNVVSTTEGKDNQPDIVRLCDAHRDKF